MSNLLTRYAEAIFWLARYVERMENLARILDVQETFSRDSQGLQDWSALLPIFLDENLFAERYGDDPSAMNVIRFYLVDAENMNSIVFSAKAARDSARSLRPLISTEMWVQLNTFYNWLRTLRANDLSEERLSAICKAIKEACQTHTGITEGTFHRDEGWYIYQLGRSLERANQTTRLLDVKYHRLLPSVTDVGSGLDLSQWNSLLRSAAAYHAFRRVYPSGSGHRKVAEFLLFNREFPRSVRACVAAIDNTLDELQRLYDVAPRPEASAQLDQLRQVLDHETIDNVINAGLHEFLDRVQQELMATSDEILLSLHGTPALVQEQSQEQAAAE